MLKFKIFLTLTSVFFVCAIIIFEIQRSVILPSYNDLEIAEAKKNINRCVDAFKSEIEHLERITLDWAAWDDTYEFITDQNEDYIKSNLTNQSFLNNHLNLICFINPDGRLVWGKTFDYKQKKESDPKQVLSNTVLKNKIIIRHNDPRNYQSGILLTELGPLMFASRPIVKSDYTGQIHGTLIMGTLIDKGLVEKIADQLRVNLIAYSMIEASNQGHLIDIINKLKSDSLYSYEALDENTMRIYKMLNDIYTNPVVLLKIDISRVISKEGIKTLRFTHYSTIMVWIITLITLIIIFHYIVVKPIRKITHHAINIRESKDLSKRLELKQKDEFGLLASAFNHMVNQIQKTNNSLENRTNELNKSLEEIKILRGIIPICSYCKKIRDDDGIWNQLEAYIHSHSNAEFSHGVCPECYKKQMAELNKE